MAGQLDDVPAGERAPVVEQVRIQRVADEGREGMALLDQLVGAVARDTVAREPGGDPLGPVLAPPHPLALRVVESALVHGGARGGGRSRSTADVVRMEVGDRDPVDRRRFPWRLADAEPGVEKRPVDEVAVDVLRAGGQRQRQPLHPVFE